MAFLLRSSFLLLCCYRAISIMENSKILLLCSFFPLLPFFLLCLLECLQASPRHHVISSTRLAHSAQLVARAAGELVSLPCIHSLPRGLWSSQPYPTAESLLFKVTSGAIQRCSPIPILGFSAAFTLLSVAQHHGSGAVRCVGG